VRQLHLTRMTHALNNPQAQRCIYSRYAKAFDATSQQRELTTQEWDAAFAVIADARAVSVEAEHASIDEHVQSLSIEPTAKEWREFELAAEAQTRLDAYLGLPLEERGSPDGFYNRLRTHWEKQLRSIQQWVRWSLVVPLHDAAKMFFEQWGFVSQLIAPLPLEHRPTIQPNAPALI
jgi:hypothetical protein